MKKEENILQPMFDTMRYLWRHRPGIKIFGHTIMEDNHIPGSVLDTFDALNFETKAGLKPVLAHKHKTPQGWHLAFNLPPGICSKDIENKLSHFREQSGGMIELKTNGSKLHMEVCTEPLPKKILYEPEQYEMFMPLPIGLSSTGPVVVDLADIPHVFVAGNTGGGKSNELHIFANSLIKHNAIVVIIDLKRLEFAYLKNHALIARTEEETEKVLRLLNKEMDRRLKKLEEANCLNLKQYKGKDMPFAALIVDELAELQSESAQRYLNRIGRLSRATGISIIAATQRPSATIYKNFTDTRALFAGRLCFSVADATNSQMVLGNDLAAQIEKNIPGRAVWQWDKQSIVQAYYLPYQRAKKFIADTPRKEVNMSEPRSQRLLPR